MARPATGQVIPPKGPNQAWRIRFTLPSGQRRTRRLGTTAEGWTERRAREALDAVLADLRRGLPNALATPAEPRADPSFVAFAAEWFESKLHEIDDATADDYRWRLEKHLIPYFGRLRLSQITFEQVDRYKHVKLADGRRRDELIAAAKAQGASARDEDGRPILTFGKSSLNKTLTTLNVIMERAVRYGYIERNPAHGAKVKAPRPRQTALDSAAAITALLNAAAELDREGRVRPYRRVLLALLLIAGPRIDEALSLRRRHVDVANRRLRVVDSKTDAGIRTVDLRTGLVEDLTTYLHGAPRDPDAYVFSTSTGAKMSDNNLRSRMLASAIERANERLLDGDRPPLPEGLTFHSLRRTYVSVLVAFGETPPYLMSQVGHRGHDMTYGVYAKPMKRSRDEIEALWAIYGEPPDHDVPARFGTGSALTIPELEAPRVP